MKHKVFLFLLLFTAFYNACAQDEKFLKKGDGYFNAGNIFAATSAYEEAYNLKKDNPYTNLQLAKCYLEISRPSKALEHANNAVKLSPKPTSEMYLFLAAALI